MDVTPCRTMTAEGYQSSDRFANPFIAAERGHVDEVIEPHETRARVIRALRMLEDNVDTMPQKTHGSVSALVDPVSDRLLRQPGNQ